MILEDIQEKKYQYPAKEKPGFLSPGDLLNVGGIEITIKESYLENWYKVERRAKDGDGGMLLYAKGNWSLWKNPPSSLLLPKILACTESEIIVAPGKGCDTKLEFKPHQNKEYAGLIIDGLAEIANMIKNFNDQKISVLYINPDSLYLCEGKIRLNLLPDLCEINNKAFSSKDLVAPEVFSHEKAAGKEGVFVLGALTVKLFTGETVNSYVSRNDIDNYIANINVPGIPQFVTRTLTNAEHRFMPVEALNYLKNIMAERKTPVKFDIGMSSSVGLNEDRAIDEDSCGFVLENALSSAGKTLLMRACLADGIGGMAAGEVASRAAVEGFLKPETEDKFKEISDLVLDLAWRANDNIFSCLNGKNGGCAFIGVVFKDETFSLANVGDSRAYMWKASNKNDEPGLLRLTNDHSYVALMVSNGNMTEEEARVSPDRNKILKSLGTVRNRQENYIDDLQKITGKKTGNLEKGDMLILVCDGIWSEISDDEFKKILSDANTDGLANININKDAQYIADILVDAAIKSGGNDNASALVIKRIS